MASSGHEDPVPPGWERVRDPDSNACYYVNHELKVKSMVNPGIGPGQVWQADIPQQVSIKPTDHGSKTNGMMRFRPGVHVVNTGGFLKQMGSPGPAQRASASPRLAHEASDRDIADRQDWFQGIQINAMKSRALEPRVVTIGAAEVSNSAGSKYPAHRRLTSSAQRGSRPVSPSPSGSPMDDDSGIMSQALHSAVRAEHPALSGSMPVRGRNVSPSRRVGTGGGMRIIDRRHDAQPWQPARRQYSPPKNADVFTGAAKYVSSPAVLDARGERTSASTNSIVRRETGQEPSRRYDVGRSMSPSLMLEGSRRYAELYGSSNYSLYGSSRIVLADTNANEELDVSSYTEELRRRAEPLMPNRSYSPLRSSAGASMNRTSFHIKHDQYRPDVTLSRSLDSPSLANAQYYQRFENFAADSRRHGQSRNAEMNRLALYSQRQQANLMEQREMLEALQYSYQFSQVQHEELCSRFQVRCTCVSRVQTFVY
jgi:hypothetical protein